MKSFNKFQIFFNLWFIVNHQINKLSEVENTITCLTRKIFIKTWSCIQPPEYSSHIRTHRHNPLHWWDPVNVHPWDLLRGSSLADRVHHSKLCHFHLGQKHQKHRDILLLDRTVSFHSHCTSTTWFLQMLYYYASEKRWYYPFRHSPSSCSSVSSFWK